MEKQYSILHISDLHKPENCNLDNLLYSIQKDCEFYKNEGICKPDIIVISGDLVEGSKDNDGEDIIKKQYAEVGKFLEKLADFFLNGNRMRMIIVPGNHDYCYKMSKDSMELSPEEKLKEDYKLLKEAAPNVRWNWDDRRYYHIRSDIIKKQYAEVGKFLEKLADFFLNGNRMRMIIVPGNHDYCYKMSKDSMELSPEEKLKEDYKLLKEAAPNVRWNWDDRRYYHI